VIGKPAVPYVCPFCGEEDLRPAAEERWHCRSCLRLFTVTFYGLGDLGAAYPTPASELPLPTPASGIHLVDPPTTPDDPGPDVAGPDDAGPDNPGPDDPGPDNFGTDPTTPGSSR
jgi:hypothetical protein